MDLLIKEGYIVDPAAKREGYYDILIHNGIISEIEKSNTESAESLTLSADEIIDATGKVVLPGLIDLHVHLREPGQEYKETIRTGSMAAAAGGFTSICPMPNTKPATDSPEKIREIIRKAKQEAVVHILPIGAITVGQAGETITDIEGMAAEGAVAVSEDGKSVMNSAVYAEGMKRAKQAGIPVFAHCEDINLVRGGVMNAGPFSERLELPGITNEVEDIIVARDLLLAHETGVQLHLCHCSTALSVEMLKQAKEKGLRVSGETGPHYLTLTDEDIPGDNGNFKMNPPLRSRADQDALRRGIVQNTIEAIATDHAPHSSEEKECSMRKALFGIVGLETAFPLIVTEMVRTKLISLSQLVERMSLGPAKILGISKGTLQKGYTADITIADIDHEYQINPNTFLSKGRNTPFTGRKVFGKICYTIVDGAIAYQNVGNED